MKINNFQISTSLGMNLRCHRLKRSLSRIASDSSSSFLQSKAEEYLSKLKEVQTVTFRGYGFSMIPNYHERDGKATNPLEDFGDVVDFVRTQNFYRREKKLDCIQDYTGIDLRL